MSVPTTGPGGVRFRSRLEARWAALFTLLGWSWQYEPDLGLEQWIPDFLVSAGDPVLVEVKPAMSLSEMRDEHTPRIEKSGTGAKVWIVGAAFAYPSESENLYVGLIGRRKLSGWAWWPVTLEEVALSAGVDSAEVPTFEKAQRLWVRASNAFQWRKR